MTKNKATGIKNVLEHSRDKIFEKLRDSDNSEIWPQLEDDLKVVLKKLDQIDICLM